MAKTSITQLKNWFKNGLKPLQEHFWNWMDSYWHKDEMIPIDTIAGLDVYFDQVASDINQVSQNYPTKDAANLSPRDVASWADVLGVIYTDEELEVTVELSFIEGVEIQSGFNKAVDVILENHENMMLSKLGKPTEVGVFAVQVTEEKPGEIETEYVSIPGFETKNKGTWMLRLNGPGEGFSEEEYFLGFIAPFDIKINDIKILLNTPVGALGSVKVSTAVNSTFIGVNEMFFEVTAGNKVSSNTPDIIGMTFSKGDFFEFYIDSAINNTADTIMAFVEYEEVEQQAS